MKCKCIYFTFGAHSIVTLAQHRHIGTASQHHSIAHRLARLTATHIRASQGEAVAPAAVRCGARGGARGDARGDCGDARAGGCDGADGHRSDGRDGGRFAGSCAVARVARAGSPHALTTPSPRTVSASCWHRPGIVLASVCISLHCPASSHIGTSTRIAPGIAKHRLHDAHARRERLRWRVERRAARCGIDRE